MGTNHARSAVAFRSLMIMACRTLICVTGLLLTVPVMAMADSARFSIAAQPLPQALKAFAEQAHMQLLYEYDAVANATGNAVSGKLERHAALDQLLKNTGLEAVYSSESAATIRPIRTNATSQAQAQVSPNQEASQRGGGFVVAQADQRSPTSSSSVGGDEGATAGQLEQVLVEGKVIAPDATTGTKTDTPIMETPLSVQVVTQQVLVDQRALTLDEALTNVSGVISNAFGGGQETLYLRGFIMYSTLMNGFRIEDNSTGLRTLTNAQSIEVLKGPAAILYGALEPGGIVNITTKQPQAQARYFLEQSAGSWDHFVTNLNATGPITSSGSLLYQANFSYDTANSWIDGVYNHKLFIAPTLRWDVSEATQITLEAQYTHNPFIFTNIQALPLVNGRLVEVPRENNIGVSDPFNYVVDTKFGQLRIVQRLGGQWTVKAMVGYNHSEADGYAPSLASVTPSGDSFIASRYLNHSTGGVKTLGSSVDVVGHFNMLGATHTLLLGADYYRTEKPYNGTGDSVLSSIDMIHPVYPGSPPPGIHPDDPSYIMAQFPSTTKDWSAYAQDQLQLPYELFILVGVRHDQLHIDSSYYIDYPNPPPGTVISGVSAQIRDSATTPRGGLLWHPQPWVSLYGNYAGNLTPNLGTDYLGNPLPPSRAKSYEGGLKLETAGGALRATAAYFDLTKTNVPVEDQAHPLFSTSIGELRSKGLEVDVGGEIVKGWNVVANYTHLTTTITQSTDVACTNSYLCVGNRFANVPSTAASLWSTYEVQGGPLRGLKLGGSITGQNFSLDQSNTTHYPGFTVFNALAAYSLPLRAGLLTLQLNLDNLSDKYYFTGNYSVAGAFATINPGAPRSVLATVRLQL